MPRPPRLEYAGAVYHLTSRGNGRQTIFHHDGDRLRFISQLQDNLETFEVVLYAFVLMSNHYHLLVQTRRPNLSRFAQRLNTSYGLYYRYKHGRPGHVFQGRYKAKLVAGEDYLLRLTRYIHLNPIKTKEGGGLPRDERLAALEQYRWSSYPGYVLAGEAKAWVDYGILRRYGRSWVEARRRYGAYVRAMAIACDEPLRDVLGANAYAVGDEAFLKSIDEALRAKRKGDGRDRDVALPGDAVGLDEIDRVVAKDYGMKGAGLKAHGHIAGEAKVVALELAARLSGRTQREIGRHYGGISSSAVAMMRRKVRAGQARLQSRVESLLARFSA